MSIALVIIKKDIGGHTWSNTHGVWIGATTGIPTDADLTSIGAGGTFTAAQTSGAGATNFLQRLIHFERMLHGPAVHFNSVYVTDGKNGKEAGSPKVYYTAPLDLVGANTQMGPLTQTGMEPGGVVWLVRRMIVGFSHKPGRLFLRGCLGEAQVQLAGTKMIDWESTGVRDQWTTQLNSAVTTSTLNTHFSGGTNAGQAILGVPHYLLATETTDPLAVGDLGAVMPISGFANAGVALRQVQRGRRKKKAA